MSDALDTSGEAHVKYNFEKKLAFSRGDSSGAFQPAALRGLAQRIVHSSAVPSACPNGENMANF